MKRKIALEIGIAALVEYCENPETAPKSTVMTAVRFTLEELAEIAPGTAVEVRVPPAGAVQILEGTNHRRGTPPAVVETDVHTWLQLVRGDRLWKTAVEAELVDASGERADLSHLLPLQTLPSLQNLLANPAPDADS